MKKLKHKYELLAPAGDMPMLVAAVNAGADSVYLGMKEFNMRANAKNFSLEDLKEARKICDKNGVKIYLTLNTIMYPDEIKKLDKIILEVKKLVDAIICWDLSVVELCKKHRVPFHISTQASVANIEAAKFYKKLGAERIVLARELNLKQIKEIVKKVPGLEIETFCHGAMCVSVSGRCFMSQHLFCKSANRGECIQPCRRAYIIKDEEGKELKLENNRVMSPKDMCTLPFVEKMKAAGIMGFKIEGRNRDPRYVDTVVKIYRKALDKKLSQKEIKDGLEELGKVYNRGFSSGFYLGTPTADDWAENENNLAKEKKHFVGKVSHYFDKISVAVIKVSSEFKVGDEVCFIGSQTGIVKTKIESIQKNKNSMAKAEKGDEVGIKVPSMAKVGDDVYRIVK